MSNGSAQPLFSIYGQAERARACNSTARRDRHSPRANNARFLCNHGVEYRGRQQLQLPAVSGH